MSDAATLRAELASIQTRQNEVMMKLRDMQAPRQGHQSRGSSWEVPSSRSYGTADAARRDVREGMFALCFVRLVWAYTRLFLSNNSIFCCKTACLFDLKCCLLSACCFTLDGTNLSSCSPCWLFDSTTASSPRRVLASSRIFLIQYVFSLQFWT